MKRLLAIFFLLTLLIVPAFAQSVSYTCPTGSAIYTLDMVGNSPVYTSFTLYRQDGTTTTGYWSYQPYTILGYPLATKMTISMDGDTEDAVFVTWGQMHVSMYPSRNFTELAESRWIMGAGQSGAVNNIAVQKYGVTSPIVGFSFDADSEITYTKTEDKIETITENLQAPDVGEILGLITSTIGDAVAFVQELLYWIQYFFIDNLAMIVALFLAVPMAFAAKNSRGNPEKFLRQYFKTLRGFFEFILSLWRMLLESIGTIRGWFRV